MDFSQWLLFCFVLYIYYLSLVYSCSMDYTYSAIYVIWIVSVFVLFVVIVNTLNISLILKCSILSVHYITLHENVTRSNRIEYLCLNVVRFTQHIAIHKHTLKYCIICYWKAIMISNNYSVLVWMLNFIYLILFATEIWLMNWCIQYS